MAIGDADSRFIDTNVLVYATINVDDFARFRSLINVIPLVP